MNARSRSCPSCHSIGPQIDGCQDQWHALQLPDGTSHVPIRWEDLKPYERDQGGYWLYGPWCDVYGNGKIWVGVRA